MSQYHHHQPGDPIPLLRDIESITLYDGEEISGGDLEKITINQWYGWGHGDVAGYTLKSNKRSIPGRDEVITRASIFAERKAIGNAPLQNLIFDCLFEFISKQLPELDQEP